MYKSVQTERLYEQIVQQIEAGILSGGSKVGDRLPPERELATQFGVSRTAVREAVKTLREKGLVEIRPGRGTFFTDGTLPAVRQSLDRMLRIGSASGLRNLVEVREIIEPEIAARAATRATAEHVAAMREAFVTMDRSLDDAEAFIEADLEFHRALAKATQNDLVRVLVDSIVDLLREQRSRIFRVSGGPQRGQVHHKRILAAVERHDAPAARTAMQAHLEQVRKDSEASLRT